ncbi:acyltransferase [Dechloromonas sp. H13]|uniref:acyltransferase family protein n=1 Tax=Dechloromonas sp. H13 TaxID=2570193 RepID=UPI001291E8F1|nr:acyltransferase [Dechloromonas sp. H13]
MSNPPARMPLIDALKAVASQLIVLHHLSAYGPLSVAMHQAAPDVAGWFYEYARMAVQVFLVIGGFLAARGLSAQGDGLAGQPLGLIWKRYLRLVVPFMAAIMLAIVGAALADHWMDDEAIPARATLAQWLAHLFLLHGVLGFDSLSAGVWYVAIDFQLFALMAFLLWLGAAGRAVGGMRHLAMALVCALAVASLLWFNRDASWDNWALYFFGAYGLGAAAWWAAQRGRLTAWLGVIAAVGILALVVDFRLRIALALTVALGLGFAQRSGLLQRWPDNAVLAYLGRISFSVFLVHFPICLLANGLYAKFGLSSASTAALGIALAWAASIGVAALFYRYVESPAASLRITATLAWPVRRLLKLG